MKKIELSSADLLKLVSGSDVTSDGVKFRLEFDSTDEPTLRKVVDALEDSMLDFQESDDVDEENDDELDDDEIDDMDEEEDDEDLDD